MGVDSQIYIQRQAAAMFENNAARLSVIQYQLKEIGNRYPKDELLMREQAALNSLKYFGGERPGEYTLNLTGFQYDHRSDRPWRLGFSTRIGDVAEPVQLEGHFEGFDYIAHPDQDGSVTIPDAEIDRLGTTPRSMRERTVPLLGLSPNQKFLIDGVQYGSKEIRKGTETLTIPTRKVVPGAYEFTPQPSPTRREFDPKELRRVFNPAGSSRVA